MLENLFIDGIQCNTGIRNYVGNQINTLYDNITLRNFSIIETIKDTLKTFVRLNAPGTGALPTFYQMGSLACWPAFLWQKNQVFNRKRFRLLLNSFFLNFLLISNSGYKKIQKLKAKIQRTNYG